MSFSEKLSNFLITIFAFAFWLFVPSVALAAFDASMCNVMNVVTGTAGRTFAAFAVASVGVGFYTGKVSWGVLVGTAAGIAVIFGAPSIVAAVSGSDVFECRKGVQVVTCNDDGCFACPVGFTGADCDECSVGFSGDDCNQCQNGYVGERCSECSDGFSKVDGMCQAGCKITEEKGLTTSSLDPGSKTIKCDKLNFTGTYKYSCTNGALQVLSNSCVCQRNFTGENCDQCNPGYKGNNCEECDAGYTMINKVCHKDCQVEDSDIAGVVGKVAIAGIVKKTVLPLSGSLACDKDIKKFSGSVNYSCIGGVFKIESGSCVCATGYKGDDCLSCNSGYVADANGNCVGALSCSVSITGSSVKKTINHEVQDTATCDVAGYSGSASYTCNNGDLLVNVPCYKSCSATVSGISAAISLSSGLSITKTCDVSGYSGTAELSCNNGVISVKTPCYKNCAISIAGVTSKINVNHGGSGQATCNAAGYASTTVNFSCDDGVATSGSCSCAAGYGGNNCSECVGNFSKVGTSCLAKCAVAITGSSQTSVDSGDGTVSCDKTGYSGASISYNCQNGTTITGSCSCAAGYSGTNCASCATGYVATANGSCAKICAVSIAGTSTTQVNPGSFSFSCDKTGYSGTSISGDCTSGVLNITSTTKSCNCAANYTGANCSSCAAGYDITNNCSSCLSDYALVSGQCRKKCLLNVTGIASGTYVNHGTTSKTCDSGYSGTINYTCTDGVISGVSGTCQASDCTGGEESSVGKKYHIFKSSGTFRCPVAKSVQYLVIAGGGGGGRRHGGGGGAGGFLEGSSLSISANVDYPVVVGNGGVGSTTYGGALSTSNGGNSSFNGIVATGGGGGANNRDTGGVSGAAGGSGGGGSNGGSGGAGTSGQGNKGGDQSGGSGCCSANGAGGGGAGAAASNTEKSVGSNGGAGKSSSITGSSVIYAGGGGGGNNTDSTVYSGGSGGGGSGARKDLECTAGASNTGGGGGGGGVSSTTDTDNVNKYESGCAGGSGVVIISY